MPFRDSLACGLQKCVGNLWKGDDYSDFIVIVEDTSFKCHRFILSACSEFFRGMFKSPMKEQEQGCAKLEGMTASTFDTIINAVYTGIDGLNKSNVLDVWAASEMLLISYLTDQCRHFVMENISIDDCFRFLNHATLYAAADVVDHCLDFISRNFENFKDEDKLLDLPFDQFHKVIANDYLATGAEEMVVDVVLNWAKYAQRSGESTSLDAGDKAEDMENEHSDDENTDDNKATVSCDTATDRTKTCSLITETGKSIDTSAVTPVHCNNTSKNIRTFETKIENRKQHLCQLLSACRLFTIKSNFLDNVMKNNARLLVDTGAYLLMHEALVYTLDVSRRHDTWPDAAVYRASSKFKHVMVFLLKDKIVSYVLDSLRIFKYAELPEGCKSHTFITITVFDNVLYLLTGISRNRELYMLVKETKVWVKVISTNDYTSAILLPHGNNIYCCGNRILDCFCCAHGCCPAWSKCCQLERTANCLIRFHQYILGFVTDDEDDVTTVQGYNTETKQIHNCETSMSGTSQDMVSFTHGEDVYILQRNGSLWKLFNTDTTPVDFELVSKLWDFDCSLKGCVLYKQILFIFCNNEQFELTLVSLPGICTKIKLISINSRTPCLPMIQKFAV